MPDCEPRSDEGPSTINSTVVVTARRNNIPTLAATLSGAVLLAIAVHLLPDVNNLSGIVLLTLLNIVPVRAHDSGIGRGRQ